MKLLYMPGGKKGEKYIIVAVLFFVYLIFSMPTSPPFEPLGYDKEVFQYMGMILDNQQLPYTNAFDHKPPVIYLLNYLGFVCTPNSTWGIFIIMNVFGFLSSLLIYKIASTHSKNQALSILITTLFICLSHDNYVLMGGNLTRQFTAFLNVGIIYLVFNTPKIRLAPMFLGILIGIIFFTQQNEILGGLFLISYYLFFKKKINLYPLKKIIANISLFLTGLLIPIITIFTIIYNWNNCDDFISQAFLFNFDSYIPKESFLTKYFRIIYIFSKILFKNPVFFISFVLIISNLMISNIIVNRNRLKVDFNLILVIIAFILQIISSSLSGQEAYFYFLMSIPYVILILIFSFSENTLPYIKYILLLLGISLILEAGTVISLEYKQSDNKLLKEVIRKVDKVKNTHGQFYTFYAPFLRVNFNLSITSPSKWIYTHFINPETAADVIKDLKKSQTIFVILNDLKYKHFMNSEMAAELIKDLQKNKTRYVFLTTSKLKYLPEELKSFLIQNYTQILVDGEYILYENIKI